MVDVNEFELSYLGGNEGQCSESGICMDGSGSVLVAKRPAEK
jgi:hypothetical protein